MVLLKFDRFGPPMDTLTAATESIVKLSISSMNMPAPARAAKVVTFVSIAFRFVSGVPFVGSELPILLPARRVTDVPSTFSAVPLASVILPPAVIAALAETICPRAISPATDSPSKSPPPTVIRVSLDIVQFRPASTNTSPDVVVMSPALN